MTFSRELISKIRAYFLLKFGEEISDDQATIYLASLARVYSTIADVRGRGGGGSAALSGEPPPPS